MLTHERASALRAELRELQSKSSYTVDDLTRIDEIGEGIATAISDRSRRATIDDLGAPPDLSAGGFAFGIGLTPASFGFAAVLNGSPPLVMWIGILFSLGMVCFVLARTGAS